LAAPNKSVQTNSRLPLGFSYGFRFGDVSLRYHGFWFSARLWLTSALGCLKAA
jgi:hypothetical protein